MIWQTVKQAGVVIPVITEFPGQYRHTMNSGNRFIGSQSGRALMVRAYLV
jgi:hypothetical protein